MMWLTPVYSFTYPATPNDARSRTSSALAIVPLNTTIGGFSGATRRRLRTRSMPGRWGDAGQGPPGRSLLLRLQRRQQLLARLHGHRPVAGPSRAVWNRSRTKAVSSAINTVLTATMVVAVTTLRIGMAWLLR